jgi:hypothetical protein
MDIALWIVASILAVAFLAGGVSKLVRTPEQLAQSGFGFVEDFSPGMVKVIGALEVMGGVGLVLPAVVGVAPILVPLAAGGIVLLMVGAMVTHLRRHEPQALVVNATILVLAAFIAAARFGPQSFTG